MRPSKANLTHLATEVPDDWYLQAEEWKRMWAERDYVEWVRSDIQKAWYHREERRRYERVKKATAELAAQARVIRARFTPHMTDQKMEMWKWEAEAWNQLATTVLEQAERLLELSHSPELKMMEKLREDFLAVTDVAFRLQKREDFITKAIAAGLYMSAGEITRLHIKGVLTRDQMQNLKQMNLPPWTKRQGPQRARR